MPSRQIDDFFTKRKQKNLDLAARPCLTWTRSAFGECFHDYLVRLGHRGNARDLEALLISPLRVAVNDVKRICETGGKIDVNATVLDTLTKEGAAETPYRYSYVCFCMNPKRFYSQTCFSSMLSRQSRIKYCPKNGD